MRQGNDQHGDGPLTIGRYTVFGPGRVLDLTGNNSDSGKAVMRLQQLFNIVAAGASNVSPSPPSTSCCPPLAFWLLSQLLDAFFPAV